MYYNIRKRLDKFDNYILFVIEKYVHNKYLDIIMPVVTFTGNLGSYMVSNSDCTYSR